MPTAIKKQCTKCGEKKTIECFDRFRSGRGSKKSYIKGECSECRKRIHALTMAKARYRKYFIDAEKESIFLAVAEMCRDDRQILAQVMRDHPEKYQRMRKRAMRKYLEPLYISSVNRGGAKIVYFGSREEIWNDLAIEFKVES